MATTDLDRLLTIPELASAWSVSVVSIRRLIWAGLPAVRIGRSLRVSSSAAAKYAAAHTAKFPGC
jgi:hypothetical protein